MVTENEYTFKDDSEYLLYLELDSVMESVDYHLCTYSQYDLTVTELHYDKMFVLEKILT